MGRKKPKIIKYLVGGDSNYHSNVRHWRRDMHVLYFFLL